jgi:hypothetical protein
MEFNLPSSKLDEIREKDICTEETIGVDNFGFKQLE